jgi:hypothetical protein
MDAVLWKGKAIQDHGLTLLSSFFNVRLRLSYIPIFDNLGKNQVNLMSIFLSWISKEEKENKELRIAVTL